jgi:hypothetical protein
MYIYNVREVFAEVGASSKGGGKGIHAPVEVGAEERLFDD